MAMEREVEKLLEKEKEERTGRKEKEKWKEKEEETKIFKQTLPKKPDEG